YAVDLGTEVKVGEKSAPAPLVAVKIVKGTLQLTSKHRETATYLIRNRSAHERLLVIEHSVRSGWKLLSKPAEFTRDVCRFEIKVPADQFRVQEITEERDTLRTEALLDTGDKEIGLLLAGWDASSSLKSALKKASDLHGRLIDTTGELGRIHEELRTIQ